MRQDRSARWTIKYTKTNQEEASAPKVDLAIPA
jgi:hypothetical protein